MWLVGLILGLELALILSQPSGPYTTVLIFRGDLNQTAHCLGTILSEDSVLTAAHCVDTGAREEYTVVAGNLKSYLAGVRGAAERLSLKSIKLHPYYPHQVDLAVVKLTTNIDLETSRDVQAAVLPPVGIDSKNKDLKGNFFDFWGNTLVQFGGIHDDCADAFEWGMYLGSKMYCGDENNRCKKKSGAGAILPGWKKPIVLGVSTFAGKDCKTFPVFQEIESSLPWIFRETSIEPAYDVLNDDRFYSTENIDHRNTAGSLINADSLDANCTEGCELMDTDFPGNDIDNIFDVPSWDECSALCSATLGCTAWTWVDERFTLAPSIVHKCHLKFGKPPAKPGVTGLISGTAGCRACKNPEKKKTSCELIDMDLVGYLTKVYNIGNIPSWEECSNLCSQRSGCTVWTWGTPSYSLHVFPVQRCYLGEGSPAPTYEPGLVSGHAGCKIDHSGSISLVPKTSSTSSGQSKDGGDVLFIGPAYLKYGPSEVLNLPSLTKANCTPPGFPHGRYESYTGTLTKAGPLLCGGYHSYNNRATCYVLARNGTWMQVEGMKSKTSHPASVETGAGWWVADRGTSEMWDGNSWQDYDALPEYLWRPCMVRLNSTHVLLTGGKDPYTSKSGYAASYIHSKATGFVPVEDMNTPRHSHACGLVDGNKAFVVAGSDGFTDIAGKTSEYFSLETLKWHEGPSIPGDTWGGEMVSWNNRTYFLGHKDILELVKSGNVWEWLKVGEMRIKRRFFKAFAMKAEDCMGWN
jgi:hypothetical protein